MRFLLLLTALFSLSCAARQAQPVAAGEPEREMDPEATPTPEPEPTPTPEPERPATLEGLLGYPVEPRPLQREVIQELAIDPGPAPVLHEVSATANDVTDDDAWWAQLGATMPVQRDGERPPGVSDVASGRPLKQWWSQGPWTFAQYGYNFSEVPVLGVVKDGVPVGLFDFGAWTQPPTILPGDEDFVAMHPQWAAVAEDTLIVCHGHRTYAKSSGGANAFLTALGLEDGQVRWRSETLTCGSHFLLLGGYLVTGYGFTAEPDFVHLVRLSDGERVASHKVKSAPDWFVRTGDGRIHVRTYNTDYVFAVGKPE